MNVREAYRLLGEGKRLTLDGWGVGDYVYMGDNGEIKYEDGTNFLPQPLHLYDWVVYEEPKTLYRRPVKFKFENHSHWVTDTNWHYSKEVFMYQYNNGDAYGPWETMEEPEECEE